MATPVYNSIQYGFRVDNDAAVDSRYIAADETARLGLPAGVVYKGLQVYQQDTDKLYVLTDAENHTDADSWTEVGSGANAVLTPATNEDLGGVIIPESSDIDVDASGNLTLGDLNASKITEGTLPDAVELPDQNQNAGLKIWTGTEAQYAALGTYDDDTLYYTDGVAELDGVVANPGGTGEALNTVSIGGTTYEIVGGGGSNVDLDGDVNLSTGDGNFTTTIGSDGDDTLSVLSTASFNANLNAYGNTQLGSSNNGDTNTINGTNLLNGTVRVPLTEPGTKTDGQIWYNAGNLTARIGGADVNLGAGGGYDTIQNSGGSDFTQRTNLRFNDNFVISDNTDGYTLVGHSNIQTFGEIGSFNYGQVNVQGFASTSIPHINVAGSGTSAQDVGNIVFQHQRFNTDDGNNTLFTITGSSENYSYDNTDGVTENGYLKFQAYETVNDVNTVHNVAQYHIDQIKFFEPLVFDGITTEPTGEAGTIYFDGTNFKVYENSTDGFVDVIDDDLTNYSSNDNGTNATDGHVLTADGSGGVAWEEVSSGTSYTFEEEGTALTGQSNVNKINFKGSGVTVSVDSNDNTTVDVDVSAATGITETTGTWTPQALLLTTTNSDDGNDFSNKNCKYVKQGSIVHCYGRVGVPYNTDNTEFGINISSLPFSIDTPSNVNGGIMGINTDGENETNPGGHGGILDRFTRFGIGSGNNGLWATDDNNLQFQNVRESTVFFSFTYITND